MIAKMFNKDPDAILDFKIDWTDWLGSTDTVFSSSWSVPSGITKTNDSSDSTSATIWISGGTAESTYDLVNTIATSQGRTEQRTIRIIVNER